MGLFDISFVLEQEEDRDYIVSFDTEVTTLLSGEIITIM